MRFLKLGELVLIREKNSHEWVPSRIEKTGRNYFYPQKLTGGPLLKFPLGRYDSVCGNFKMKFIE